MNEFTPEPVIDTAMRSLTRSVHERTAETG
jgi:hypothetical protein